MKEILYAVGILIAMLNQSFKKKSLIEDLFPSNTKERPKKPKRKKTSTAPKPIKEEKPPKKMKKIFISYCWEDEEHKKWINKFSNDLLLKGFDVK